MKTINFADAIQPFANRIRDKVITIGYKHQSSHIGSALSCVELLSCIYILKGKDDIVILSKGHACLTQYAILNELGLISQKKLDNYPKLLGCHPEINKRNGIYASTGSLGHGIAIALGYAIANPFINVYVLMGDGEMDEGSVWESINIKERLKIDNLIVVVDRNGFKGYDEVKVAKNLPDGHNIKEIVSAFKNRDRYPVLDFKTIKGKGLKRFENQLGSHYWNINLHDYDEYQKGLLRKTTSRTWKERLFPNG